jgi:hypothetical protein
MWSFIILTFPKIYMVKCMRMKYVALVLTRSAQGTEENFVHRFDGKVKERDDLEDLDFVGLNLKG